MSHSKSPSRLPTKKDEDIEQLKQLVSQLMHQTNDSSEFARRQSANRQYIHQLENKIKQLNTRVVDLQSENDGLRREVVHFKDRLAVNEQNLVVAQKQIRVWNATASPNRDIEVLQPSKKEESHLRSYKTPISQLEEFNSDSNNSTRDQLYRLNSYLIEHNTATKLLVQKYNYLLKLRGLNITSEADEQETIAKTKAVLKDRKVIEQAKSTLKNSRKLYFESDNSSDIEEEVNGLQI